ncbi:MAG: cytochrome b/b6 domain-containing protein [Gammaproteobacteria bacterium]|nr:cytochrome b/b6 domain-containing protein [Gammaproteobacteria bacterium]
MLEEKIRRVPVWSGALRALHWSLAAGVVFQLASGWLMGQGVRDPDFWRDWHLMTGQAVLVLVLCRLALLFRQGPDNWRSFVPKSTLLQGARQTLSFYVSLGKAPLPNWYAHNPLWALLYPLLAALILVAAISGIFHEAPYLIAGLSPAAVHGGAVSLLVWLMAAHVVTAVVHDLKGKGAFISAMINGNRYFHVSVQPLGPEPPVAGRSVDVTFDTAPPDRPISGAARPGAGGVRGEGPGHTE